MKNGKKSNNKTRKTSKQQNGHEHHNHNNKNKKGDNNKNIKRQQQQYGIVSTITICFLVSGAVVAAVLFHWKNQQQRVNDMSPIDKLFYFWPPGDAVTVHTFENGIRGLVATRNIPKDTISIVGNYEDLEGSLLVQHPELKYMVQQVLQIASKQHQTRFDNRHVSCVLALIRFLQLVDVEQNPKWVAYAETLPKNITSVGMFWSQQEKECMVSRRSNYLHLLKRNLILTAFDTLATKSSFVKSVYSSPQRVEWALLMFNTRAFADVNFLPSLDMANHNPRQALPIFQTSDKKQIYVVAPHDIAAGEQVFANYGLLSPLHSAEEYGFVVSEEDSAYFEVPSIREDMFASPNTITKPACLQETFLFYGRVVGGEQLVEATIYFGHQKASQSVNFKAFMPTKSAYSCIEHLLQTDDDIKVAEYIANRLDVDYQRYAKMSNEPKCQSNEGNFPMIRQANQIQANLLWEAYEISLLAANGTIPYPGIPAYKAEK